MREDMTEQHIEDITVEQVPEPDEAEAGVVDPADDYTEGQG